MLLQTDLVLHTLLQLEPVLRTLFQLEPVVNCSHDVLSSCAAGTATRTSCKPDSEFTLAPFDICGKLTVSDQLKDNTSGYRLDNAKRIHCIIFYRTGIVKIFSDRAIECLHVKQT